MAKVAKKLRNINRALRAGREEALAAGRALRGVQVEQRRVATPPQIQPQALARREAAIAAGLYLRELGL